MSKEMEQKILYLSRAVAMMRDLTGHLSQAHHFDYGREMQNTADKLLHDLDAAVGLFDQARDRCALEVVDQNHRQELAKRLAENRR